MTTGQPPLYVTFYDRSVPNYSGNYYLWDFGDGTTSYSLMNAIHCYEDYGKYSVSLTVGLPCGAIDDTVMVNYIVVTCCEIRGDVDHSGGIDAADLTYLVAYLFTGGPHPSCDKEGDVDGSDGIDVADLTYLVAYLFTGGQPPPPCP